ncbi:MAG: toxin-antitoxin system YwqK family antitoxin [bacterium]|nr:toxin-antitoxin system YwqK family antitoxin [bacterium]
MMNYKSRVIFFLLLISITILSISCGKEEIPKSTLVIKDNLLYKQGSNVPFTGRERALVENKIIEYDVKDGLKHGDFRIFSEEGVLEMEGQTDSNRNVGKWKYFYSDGKIESEGNFVNDIPEGLWIWNYPDGKKKEEGHYKQGKRVGLWYIYDTAGNISFEKNYDIEDSTTVEDEDLKIID